MTIIGIAALPSDVRKGSAFPPGQQMKLLSHGEAKPRHERGGIVRLRQKAIGLPHIGRQSRFDFRPLSFHPLSLSLRDSVRYLERAKLSSLPCNL